MKVGKAVLLILVALGVLTGGSLLLFNAMLNGNLLLAVIYGLTIVVGMIWCGMTVINILTKPEPMRGRRLPQAAKMKLGGLYSVCEKACGSLETKREQFEGYPRDDSLRQTFDLISKRIILNMDRANRYIDSYDYVTLPDPVYLRKVANNSSEMIRKLNELSDLALQIEDSATDVDSSSADYMLEALRDLLKEDDEDYE